MISSAQLHVQPVTAVQLWKSGPAHSVLGVLKSDQISAALHEPVVSNYTENVAQSPSGRFLSWGVHQTHVGVPDYVRDADLFIVFQYSAKPVLEVTLNSFNQSLLFSAAQWN